jgi:hypothetical protein
VDCGAGTAKFPKNKSNARDNPRLSSDEALSYGDVYGVLEPG